jgi:hypothetical protein
LEAPNVAVEDAIITSTLPLEEPNVAIEDATLTSTLPLEEPNVAVATIKSTLPDREGVPFFANIVYEKKKEQPREIAATLLEQDKDYFFMANKEDKTDDRLVDKEDSVLRVDATMDVVEKESVDQIYDIISDSVFFKKSAAFLAESTQIAEASLASARKSSVFVGTFAGSLLETLGQEFFPKVSPRSSVTDPRAILGHTDELDYSSSTEGETRPWFGELNARSGVQDTNPEKNGNAIIEDEDVNSGSVPVEKPSEIMTASETTSTFDFVETPVTNYHTDELDYSSPSAGSSLTGLGYLNSLSRVQESKPEKNGKEIIEDEGVNSRLVPVEMPSEITATETTSAFDIVETPVANDHTDELDDSSSPAGGSLSGLGYLNSLSRVQESKPEKNGKEIIEDKGMNSGPVSVEMPSEMTASETKAIIEDKGMNSGPVSVEMPSKMTATETTSTFDFVETPVVNDHIDELDDSSPPVGGSGLGYLNSLSRVQDTNPEKNRNVMIEDRGVNSGPVPVEKPSEMTASETTSTFDFAENPVANDHTDELDDSSPPEGGSGLGYLNAIIEDKSVNSGPVPAERPSEMTASSISDFAEKVGYLNAIIEDKDVKSGLVSFEIDSTQNWDLFQTRNRNGSGPYHRASSSPFSVNTISGRTANEAKKSFIHLPQRLGLLRLCPIWTI